MARNRQNALAQVRAALEIANRETTGQEEAAIALAGAARLMAFWEIEEGEITDVGRTQANTKIRDIWFRVSNMDNAGAQRRDAVFGLVRALGASALYMAEHNDTGSGVYGFSLHIFGVESTIDFLELMLPSFILQLENCLKADTALYQSDAKASGEYTTKGLARLVSSYRRTYIVGFGHSVAERIKKFRRDAIDESTKTGTGELVLKSDHDRAEAARNEVHKNIRNVKSRQNVGNFDGLRDGKAAGSRALVGQTDLSNNNRRAIEG